ncbi:hypothetical protein GCM10023331_27280 [Algivirga pacifica]|uniref:Uncharacterized protein n=2 Tax=Algivirga pacifica TaxID=1162670 RepID=A0ABP9DDK6_9BACT
MGVAQQDEEEMIEQTVQKISSTEILDATVINHNRRTQLSKRDVKQNGYRLLPFYFEEPDELLEIRIKLKKPHTIASVKPILSPEYEIDGEIINVNEEFFRVYLRFTNLVRTNTPSFTFAIWTMDGQEILQELKFLPYTETRIEMADHTYRNKTLYVGEDQVFDLISNHPENIKTDNLWKESDGIFYRIANEQGKLQLHVMTQNSRDDQLSFRADTYIPHILADTLLYQTNPINLTFSVKSSRLAFLGANQKEITLTNEALSEGVEIEIENHRNLRLQKTYRLEEQEAKGGKLMAELYTKARLSNNRILCELRPYSTHDAATGYLYIKDGDTPLFLTNFTLSKPAQIQKVSILKSGRNWSTNLTVNPGEIVDLRIEGEELDKSYFKFAGTDEIKEDSLLNTPTLHEVRIRIPMNINLSEIPIYDHHKPTGYSLKVQEHQKPRKFDFVTLEYDDQHQYRVDQIDKNLFYESNIRDIVLSFNPALLDQPSNMNGKQYLEVDVRVLNDRMQLTEIAKIENFVVCPDDSSPRYQHYDKSDCTASSLRLNDYLATKTYNLEGWSRIEIKVKHKRDKYQDTIQEKKITLILSRRYNFDIDVSFPAGLLVKRFNEDDIGGLGGVSIAAMAQFQFYKKGTIAKLQPYRIGVGSIALNAFNLSDDNTDRDLGLVTLLSLHPLYKPGRKLSLPIYFGFGYLIKAETWFVMLGPGIRVSI